MYAWILSFGCYVVLQLCSLLYLVCLLLVWSVRFYFCICAKFSTFPSANFLASMTSTITVYVRLILVLALSTSTRKKSHNSTSLSVRYYKPCKPCLKDAVTIFHHPEYCSWLMLHFTKPEFNPELCQLMLSTFVTIQSKRRHFTNCCCDDCIN